MPANEKTPRFESFDATVVRYDRSPDECTIYPTEVSEEHKRTTWITAREGSFCSLGTCR